MNSKMTTNSQLLTLNLKHKQKQKQKQTKQTTRTGTESQKRRSQVIKRGVGGGQGGKGTENK